MTAKTTAQAAKVLVRPPTTSWTGTPSIGGESTRPCVGFRSVS